MDHFENENETELKTEQQPCFQREYKDRLFKAIFGRETEQSKRWRLELYNALNDTSYTDPDALELNTIENVIYITMKNDVSFLIDDQEEGYSQGIAQKAVEDAVILIEKYKVNPEDAAKDMGVTVEAVLEKLNKMQASVNSLSGM